MTFEADRDAGNKRASDMHLTAQLTELKTQAVLMTAEDGTQAYSALNAWSLGLVHADSDTAYSTQDAEAVEIVMHMSSDYSGRSGDAAPITYTVNDANGQTLLQAGAGDDALLSRFTESAVMATATTGYDQTDLSISAQAYMTADGTDMVRITLSNNAMAPAENPVIYAYALDLEMPSYTIALSDGTLSIDHRWTVTV